MMNAVLKAFDSTLMRDAGGDAAILASGQPDANGLDFSVLVASQEQALADPAINLPFQTGELGGLTPLTGDLSAAPESGKMLPDQSPALPLSGKILPPFTTVIENAAQPDSLEALASTVLPSGTRINPMLATDSALPPQSAPSEHLQTLPTPAPIPEAAERAGRLAPLPIAPGSAEQFTPPPSAQPPASSPNSDANLRDHSAPQPPNTAPMRAEPATAFEHMSPEHMADLPERFAAEMPAATTPKGSLASSPAAAINPAPSPSPAQAAASPASPAHHHQLETLIDTLTEAREIGRSARGDMLLRHAEFGSVTMRIDQIDGDLTARLSSRDPTFAAAAQTALNERAAIAASSESATTGQRGQDQSAAGQQTREQGLVHSGGRNADSQHSGAQQHGEQRSEQRAEHPHYQPLRQAIATQTPEAAWLPAERGVFA